MIAALTNLAEKHSGKRVAIVWDNAPWHTSKKLRTWLEEESPFADVQTIQLPPYAPDHNPIEHVWNHSKGAISNLQRDYPEETFTTFESYIGGRVFKYDFEHLGIHS